MTDISVLENLNNLNVLGIENNKITNISVLKDLNKLNILSLKSNNIKDISVIQYLTELEYLNIDNLQLESDQIQYIQPINSLYELACKRGFKDMNILKQLNNNIKITK